MGNSYTSKKPCSVWLVKGVGETPSTDCITDILDGEGIYVSGTKTVKVISLLPPRDGHIGGVKRKDVPENAVEIDPETGEIFVARSGVDFPITIAQGGTGKTNREDALLALLPDTLDQEGKVLSVYKKEDGSTSVKWIDMPNVDDFVQGNGINISDIDPDTGLRTISIKANSGEFRYNDNGVIELSDQVTNALAKADSSVQTVNNTPPDENGNVNVAGSLPVLTLISDFVGEISVLKNWLLAQPDQRSTLYIKTQKLPNIQVIVTATGFTQTWETLADYIKTQVRALYDGCPNFTCIYNTDGELELSTNDILNPIQMYIPIVPDNESLNVQMKLVPPGAVIVSQPYATIDQVNTIVNNAVIPLQQDIKLLNLDMFFADYYLGISINYLLSGKWDGDEVQTYNDILSQLDDSNTLKFTLSDGLGQYNYSLTITKQQFIDFADLDTFNNYISDQMASQYDLTGFRVIFKELSTQGFLITNLDSNAGILVCEQDNNNLAVIMKLTDLTSAKGRAYTEFSDNSLQAQIINNQLIIDDVFVNKIKNGENVTIDVDPATNTATFNSTGGSGGANKVTVTVNGQNPVAYNVDDTGNITINVPLTNSLKSNLLNITTIQSGANKGETELIAETTNQLNISTITKQIGLSSQTATDVAKGASALQKINITPNKGLSITDKLNNEQTLTGIPATANNIGMVKPDNITIDINNDGVISSNNVPFVIEIIGGVVESKLQNIYNWLLSQPNQEANLYIPNKIVPNMVVDVRASWASNDWDSFLIYIRARIQYLYPANTYPSLANFTISLNDGRLHLSTNLVSNPIYIYIPNDPTSLENLNAQMMLTRFTGASIGIVTINSQTNPEVILSYRNGNQYRGMDGKEALPLPSASLHPIINRNEHILYDQELDTITFEKGYKYDVEISGIVTFDSEAVTADNLANYGLINVSDLNDVYVARIQPIYTDAQGKLINYNDPHTFVQFLIVDLSDAIENVTYRRVAYFDSPIICNLLTLSHWTIKVLRVYEN